jgi:ribonuclease HI
MSKFYAVSVGRNPGIYTTWEGGAQPQINKYPGAIFKSFSSLDDAKRFLDCKSYSQNNKNIPDKSLTEDTHKDMTPIPLMNTTIVYTDGSGESSGFGYGGIIIPPDGNIVKYSEPLPKLPGLTGSSNQCELYSIYHALTKVKGDVVIYTDSKYSIGCLTEWYKKWDQNGWNGVCNATLIKKCLELMKNRSVSIQYVPAHTGQYYNEIADSLAKLGARKYNELNTNNKNYKG